jgi:uncharacterized protein (DUF4213/DUF364 family)
MIISELINHALSTVGNRKIADIRAGLGYTCVLLDNDACGLAYTFRNEMGCSCGVLPEAGNLIGRNASEIIPWLESKNLLMAAMGLAAINAVLNDSLTDYDSDNVINAIDIKAEDNFGMVGDFAPILNVVRKKAKNIYVFERNLDRAAGLYSEIDIPEYLPKCDVIVVTATSIINHTIEDVLSHCTGAREVCLVGPSTPLCPEIFKNYNVTLLAGSIVKDPEKTLQIVSQGGGTRTLKPSMEHVLIRTDKTNNDAVKPHPLLSTYGQTT